MQRRSLLLLPFALHAESIVLPSGIYRDKTLRFDGKDIHVRAESPGGVILTGSSTLTISGEGNTVEGLHFKDGAAPKAVITIQGKRNRVTNCAITNYNGPDKTIDSKWVSLYGEDNEFDHNYIAGKTNRGTTLVVWLQKGDTAGAKHRIHHNHFGPREALGENGGETIRVGDSSTSLQPGLCVIEHNWFTGCDGEIEIISNKSCGNLYRANVFKACDGTLTLRHGNGCKVQGNVFYGDNYKRAGGVRIIGEDHLVEDNYFENLPGTGNRAAISFMQGIVDTPLNGYAQVKRAKVRNNTIVHCAEPIARSVKGAKTTLEPIEVNIENNSVDPKSATIPKHINLKEAGPTWLKSG
jgi:poly(beta-D-mannuronate) lyase